MALVIEKTKALPTVTRGGGRTSEESKQLSEAVSDLSPKVIQGVPVEGDGNASSLGQKIRYAAGRVGLNVRVRTVETDDENLVDIHFEGFVPEPEKSTKKEASK